MNLVVSKRCVNIFSKAVECGFVFPTQNLGFYGVVSAAENFLIANSRQRSTKTVRQEKTESGYKVSFKDEFGYSVTIEGSLCVSGQIVDTIVDGNGCVIDLVHE